jgi:hypothetical protein
MAETQGGGGDRGWLLIETFGYPHEQPSIVNWSGRARAFLPLDKPLKNVAPRIRRAIAEVARTKAPVSINAAGVRLEAVGHWAAHHSGNLLHAVQFWSGREGDEVPPRPAAGAWWIDCTDMTAFAGPEYAEMTQMPPELIGKPRSVAAMFTMVDTDAMEAQSIRSMIQGVPGSQGQSTWTVHLPDGGTFESAFSTRRYQQNGWSGEPNHIVSRGVSLIVDSPRRDGPEPIVLLQHQLLESSTRPGEYRALIALETLRLIRWVHGSAVPEVIAWQGRAGEPQPEVHPDDRRVMIDMAKGLDRSSTSGRLRLRGVDGGWITIDATANLVALGRDTTAALVMFTIG